MTEMTKTAEHDRGPWILTYTGQRFFLFDPSPNDVFVWDICHALSHVCRFGGHVKEFWSVAQHSMLVADIVEYDFGIKDPVIVLSALLHDATEAYIGDMVRPLKSRMPEFKAIEHTIERVIFEHFQLTLPMHESIKRADQIALKAEREKLMPKRTHAWDIDEKQVASTSQVMRVGEDRLAVVSNMRVRIGFLQGAIARAKKEA